MPKRAAMYKQVFKECEDGSLEFVGKFDDLYRDVEDPWDQSGEEGTRLSKYYDTSRWKIASALEGLVAPGNVLEVGCGLGYAMEYFGTIPEIEMSGVDVSSVAVERAKSMFPQFEFDCWDIRKGIPSKDKEQYKAVVLNQILWYVLEEFDQVISNAMDLIPVNGYLIIGQGFPQGKQRFGSRIIDGFHGLLKHMVNLYSHELTIMGSHFDDHESLPLLDGVLVMRKRCKAGLT